MFPDHTQRRTTVGRTGRGLCDELITRPEESYRLWCVVVYDLETSRIGDPYDRNWILSCNVYVMSFLSPVHYQPVRLLCLMEHFKQIITYRLQDRIVTQ